MEKTYFEKIPQEDGSFIGRVYLIPSPLVFECSGTEKEVNLLIAEETAKLEA